MHFYTLRYINLGRSKISLTVMNKLRQTLCWYIPKTTLEC